MLGWNQKIGDCVIGSRLTANNFPITSNDWTVIDYLALVPELAVRDAELSDVMEADFWTSGRWRLLLLGGIWSAVVFLERKRKQQLVAMASILLPDLDLAWGVKLTWLKVALEIELCLVVVRRIFSAFLEALKRLCRMRMLKRMRSRSGTNE